MSSTPLALTIAESLLATSDMAGSLGEWRKDLRRLDLTAVDAAALADRVSECTRRAGLLFLRRTFNAAEWRLALDGASAPLVVLADGEAGPRAALVEHISRTALTMRFFTDTGLGAPEELTVDTAFTRVARGAPFVAVLFPTPRVASGPGAEDEGGGEHESERTSGCVRERAQPTTPARRIIRAPYPAIARLTVWETKHSMMSPSSRSW